MAKSKSKKTEKHYENKQLYDQIMALHPEMSDDLFDNYMKLSMFARVLTDCIDDIVEISDQILENIKDSEMVSDEYEIVFDASPKRKVNISKLRSESPETFYKCATVKPEAMRDIVGNEKCIELLKEKLGDNDLLNEFIQVNITDLNKLVGKGTAETFMVTESKRSESPIMVRKGEYPKDHYVLGSDEIIEVYMSEAGTKAPKSISKLKFD